MTCHFTDVWVALWALHVARPTQMFPIGIERVYRAALAAHPSKPLRWGQKAVPWGPGDEDSIARVLRDGGATLSRFLGDWISFLPRLPTGRLLHVNTLLSAAMLGYQISRDGGGDMASAWVNYEYMVNFMPPGIIAARLEYVEDGVFCDGLVVQGGRRRGRGRQGLLSATRARLEDGDTPPPGVASPPLPPDGGGGPYSFIVNSWSQMYQCLV